MVDQAHLKLVQARKEAQAACDRLLDSGVAWESDEYQAARAASIAASAALDAYNTAKNGPKAPRIRTPQAKW